MAITGALPSTPPAGLGMDDSARQEYFDALNKTLQALENRSNNGINLWNAAGQFFNPGRTGQFGEAVGNVATTVGRDVEKQQEMAMPIASMRASIAGQKYQVENESKALGLLAKALDTTPEGANKMVQSGEMTPDMISKIPSGLYVYLNKLDPKLGEGIKNAFNMDVERRKLVNDEVKNGLTVTDLVAKYGESVKQYLPTQMQGNAKPAAGATSGGGEAISSAQDLAGQVERDFGVKLGPLALERNKGQQQNLGDRAAKGEKGVYTPAPVVEGKETYHTDSIDVPQSVPESYMNARGWYRPNAKADPVHYVRKPTAKIETAPAEGGEDLSGLPLGERSKVMGTRTEASDKRYGTQLEEVAKWTLSTTEQTDSRLRELYNIANSDYGPRIFGIMQKQGLISGLQNAAQEGVTAGRLGSVSLPVKTFLEKTKLSPDDQKVLRRASQLIAEQFFENAKAAKSALGPQISNADAQFMQKPMVTEADADTSIKYWVKNHMLFNKQKADEFGALGQFEKRGGAQKSPGLYFRSPEYMDVNSRYSNLRKQLQQQYPDFGAK
jgi:hypothetical protein